MADLLSIPLPMFPKEESPNFQQILEDIEAWTRLLSFLDVFILTKLMFLSPNFSDPRSLPHQSLLGL